MQQRYSCVDNYVKLRLVAPSGESREEFATSETQV